MKQNKSKAKFITRFVINTLVSVQLVAPSYVFAQNTTKNTSGFLSGALNVGGSLIGAAGGILSQVQENARAQAQYERLDLALTPVEVTNSYFPGCRTLPAMTPEVFQACKSPPRTAIQRNLILKILEKSATNRRRYSEFSTIGNSRVANSQIGGTQNVNNGLSCVQDKIDSTTQLLDQRVASLTQLINSMNESKAILDANLQTQIDGLAELDGYLDGGNGLNSNHSRKYSNLFRQLGNDTNCSSVLDTVTVQNLSSQGLNSINSQVNEIRTGGGGTDLVTNLIRNQGNIQTSINKYARDLRTTVQKRGIDRVSSDLLSGNIGNLGINASLGLNNSPALVGAIQNQARQFADEQADLQDRFSRLGINDSTISNSVFTPKENNFSLKLKRWRDQKQDECLREKISLTQSGGDENSSYDYFLDLIRHADTRIRSSANLDVLKRELEVHLENNLLSIDEKIKKVEQILSQKAHRQLRIYSRDTNDGTQVRSNQSPVALLTRYADACKDEYRRIQTDTAEGRTYMEIEKEAKRIHNEFKDQEKALPNLLANSIYDRVINCRQDGEAIPYSLSSNSCNSEKLDLSSESFCLGQSVECAKTINACSEKVEQTIVSITNQGAVVASTINNLIQNFRNLQTTLLNNFKQVAQAQAQTLQQTFRNTPFNLPDNLSLEALESDVGTISDNFATFDPESLLDGFEERMNQLRQSIEEQNQQVIAEMAREQQQIASSYQEQDGYWEELENRCLGLIEQYNQQEAQRVAQAEEARAEQRKDLQDFCYSYQTYSRGPGCDENLDDLEETTKRIAGVINTGELLNSIGEVRGNCLRLQQTKQDNESGSNQVYSLKVACSSSQSNVKFASIAEQCGTPNAQGEYVVSEAVRTSILKDFNQKNQNDSGNNRSPAATGVVAFNAPVIPHCESINDYGTDFNSLSSAIDRVGTDTVNFFTTRQ